MDLAKPFESNILKTPWLRHFKITVIICGYVPSTELGAFHALGIIFEIIVQNKGEYLLSRGGGNNPGTIKPLVQDHPASKQQNHNSNQSLPGSRFHALYTELPLFY